MGGGVMPARSFTRTADICFCAREDQRTKCYSVRQYPSAIIILHFNHLLNTTFFTSLSLCQRPSGCITTPMATDFEDRLLPLQVVRRIAPCFQVPFTLTLSRLKPQIMMPLSQKPYRAKRATMALRKSTRMLSANVSTWLPHFFSQIPP